MADYNSSLPVRSEVDGLDERLQTKIVDATNPDTQQMEVDTDNNAHVEVHGNRSDDAADVALLLSEEGRVNPRGDYEVDDNSNPASVGLVAHDRNASPSETQQVQRLTAVDGSDDTVCLDVALRDESGIPYSGANPMPVTLEASEGNEVDEPLTSAALAKDASVDLDYTVGGTTKIDLESVHVSASGRCKWVLALEDGVAAGTYTTKEVAFTGTSNSNFPFDSKKLRSQITGAKIRVTATNIDKQPFDVYATFLGIED